MFTRLNIYGKMDLPFLLLWNLTGEDMCSMLPVFKLSLDQRRAERGAPHCCTHSVGVCVRAL